MIDKKSEEFKLKLTNNPAELLTQLHQEFCLKKLQLDLGGQSVDIYKVENIDDLLDRISDPEEIPFWAELWPASIGLSKFIIQNKQIFEGKTVLELGAGVGLAGITAKLAGASAVHSDFIPKAFEFIHLNCALNGLTTPEVFLADWRNFPDNVGKFDVVIGGDILYEKTLHDDLIRVFEKTLKINGEVWLADPRRDYAKVFMEKVLDIGWKLRQERVRIDYDGHDYQIDIYRLKR